MNVSECMATDVTTIDHNASLVEASRRMRDRDAGFMPVVDGGRLVGVITDRDLVVRGLAENCDPPTTPVHELMSIEIICCYPDQSVDAAAALMREHGVGRLPVVDGEHRLLGMVSRKTIGIVDEPHAETVKVTFRKTKTDSYGRPHKVPIATVYITSEKSPDAAVEKAVEHYEQEQKTSWNNRADDLDVGKVGRKSGC